MVAIMKKSRFLNVKTEKKSISLCIKSNNMREQWNAFYRMYRWMLQSAPYPDDVLIALYESKIVPPSWINLLGEDDPMTYYGKNKEDRWVLRLYRMRIVMLQKGHKMSHKQVSKLLKKLPSNKI